MRYGKPGGIAYHHISDTYIALFTHFIPCGVWEAVYIIEGLLKNTSKVKPTTVHTDTQGQSFPVFALAHLLGFDLMPRISNWKDLTFYRPTKQTEYVHIDALFGEPGRNSIDFDPPACPFPTRTRPDGRSGRSRPNSASWTPSTRPRPTARQSGARCSARRAAESPTPGARLTTTATTAFENSATSARPNRSHCARNPG